MSNRVWIEFERPKSDAHGEEIAKLGTAMLQRLFPGTKQKFNWSAHRNVFTLGDQFGYLELVDRGHWFGLDYFGL